MKFFTKPINEAGDVFFFLKKHGMVIKSNKIIKSDLLLWAFSRWL